MTSRSVTYAIGDIHGHLSKLEEVHDWIEKDRAQNAEAGSQVVHLGDLVDRGPDSAGVIAFLQSGIIDGQPWVVLKGNHDRMFAGFVDNPRYRDPGLRSELPWLDPRLGGAATLASFGVDVADPARIQDIHSEAIRKVPAAALTFLRDLPTYHTSQQVIFVHAGIRPGIPLMDQSEDDLLWIRTGFLDDLRDHGALIVHGHTAIRTATHHGNRVNIDSSAAYGGPLTAVAIEGQEVWLLGPTGRKPLLPT